MYCDKCYIEVDKKQDEKWVNVLNKLSWKWCKKSGWIKAELYCKLCAYDFERENNIDHDTGMSKH